QSTESLGLPQRLKPSLVGFEDDQALLDFDPRSHVAYRLLTEYFAFADKFNFVDIPVPSVSSLRAQQAAADEGETTSQRSITLHLVMSGVRSDSDESRLLEMTDARNFALGCTPVVNLFEQPADPIRVTQQAVSYPVVVDGRRAFGYEVYAINKVFRVKKTPLGEEVQEFRPFFSLRHDDWLADDELAQDAGNGGRYWFARRDDDLAEQSPGYETEMSIVDIDFNPAQPQTETLSLTVSATNRDLPSLLPFGVQGGDVFTEGGGVAKEIRLLRKPSASQRFDRGNGALWRLISHLSLNHLSLSSAGIDGLKEMFRLYDLSRTASNRRQIDGLVSVAFQPSTAWLPGKPFANFVRGTEIRLEVDEDSFVGSGLGLFVAVLDRFFGLYVHANSFTQLTVVSARTQEVVMSCPPRNGAMQLV
ncbi:MAG: type VI secretion system baseplate subunit TssF, partial [Aquabacterium sp.]|nr:type VI secretion system baseplate subunit TssF [Aquabacterium sp.]